MDDPPLGRTPEPPTMTARLSARPLISPHVGGAEDDPRDVDEAGVVEPVEDGLVRPAPDAGSRPDRTVGVRSISISRSTAAEAARRNR